MASGSQGRPARVPRSGSRKVQPRVGGEENELDSAGEGKTSSAAVGGVVVAVRRDLAMFAKADNALASSGLAALALALASMIDDLGNSATSRSMCAGQLRDTLDRLRELMPAESETSELDELRARRERRLAGQPGS